MDIAILVASIVGVVEVFKRGFGLTSRYAPLLALALGVLAFGFTNGWDITSIMNGVVAGLTAVGLYSGGKTTFKK